MTSQGEVAAYVATTCLELRKMASGADGRHGMERDMGLLVQLLDMAALEADNIRMMAGPPVDRVIPLKRPMP